MGDIVVLRSRQVKGYLCQLLVGVYRAFPQSSEATGRLLEPGVGCQFSVALATTAVRVLSACEGVLKSRNESSSPPNSGWSL